MTCIEERGKNYLNFKNIKAYMGWNKEERVPELERQLELVGVKQLITQQ